MHENSITHIIKFSGTSRTGSQSGLKMSFRERRAAWGYYYGPGVGWGRVTLCGHGLAEFGSAAGPTVESLEFPISLLRCGAERKREGWDFKTISSQTSNNGAEAYYTQCFCWHWFSTTGTLLGGWWNGTRGGLPLSAPVESMASRKLYFLLNVFWASYQLTHDSYETVFDTCVPFHLWTYELTMLYIIPVLSWQKLMGTEVVARFPYISEIRSLCWQASNVVLKDFWGTYSLRGTGLRKKKSSLLSKQRWSHINSTHWDSQRQMKTTREGAPGIISFPF